mmetsp:Transcript_21825/g.53974  ORF Transcript_21825/g.53974 Transcript_21825/m.53974 type:complete len:88 (-) Transcript_21825:2364-2627(-)|eukprot:CAMPEP_0113636120 /NCGR_PEP_ID=MMETSP0017_2-20120614/18850_1 /TAXON_ID=2856 /ORGANISM="Cylindrotheca closterium" /LENGTH=87 /DNA_ID=CAMNT_0000546973 /DNA_START=36 /DNA_END=299 /DNA_ORIENTATION=+ /assembly_acc=CAM_ASM_000147
MAKASSTPQMPVMLNHRPTLPMPPSLITTSPEIQEIVDRSTSERDLLTNLVSFAVDLINEDDFADDWPTTSKFSKTSLPLRNTEGRQ